MPLALLYGLGFTFVALLLVLAMTLHCVKGKRKMRIMNGEQSEGDWNTINETIGEVVSDKPSTNTKKDSIMDRWTETVVNSDVELGSQETVECELIRMHNLACPPRFLFTIAEETKEDLESEDARSRGGRTGKNSITSIGDIVVAIDTPHDSPATVSLDSWQRNRVLEASSPRPKFKFMRDAEEKLLRRLLLEEAEKMNRASPMQGDSSGSFLGFLAGVESEQLHRHRRPSVS